MIKNVAIVDYGLGNILSAQQSFLKVANDNNIEANVIVTNQSKDISESTHIVLPGQGAFETCMKGLSNIPYMINELTKSVINKKIPFLGICVGMQLLADISYENGEHKGLGWIEGQIKKLPTKKYFIAMSLFPIDDLLITQRSQLKMLVFQSMWIS